jgi:hypothetical protein
VTNTYLIPTSSDGSIRHHYIRKCRIPAAQ